MSRGVSAGLTALLALTGCESHTTLSLFLTNSTELHYSTEAFNEAIKGKDYVKGLLISDELVQSIGSETNRVTVTLQNVDKDLGLAAAAESLNFAVAVIGRFWRSGSDTNWRELYRGEARVLPELNQGEIKIEILSDLIAAGYCVANWSLDPKCSFRYKDQFCGYAGSAPTCGKTRKGPNGCQEHDVETDDFRFGGWEYPDVQPAEVGTGDGGDPGDYPDGNPCFPAGTLILMADWTEKPIELIRRGDMVMTFDPRTMKLYARPVVGDLQIHEGTEIFRSIDRGIITPTPNHGFYTRGGTKAPIETYRPGDTLLRIVRRGLRKIWVDWTIESTTVRELRRGVPSYNFEVAEFHSYIANRFAVSNRKNEPQ